jgi:large subunit ribosomal protein L32e
MSSDRKISQKIKELPHMTQEHLEVLEKHGITTPEELLKVIRDEEKWAALHPELKGIGPKTLKSWEELLESHIGEEEAEKGPAKEKKAEREKETAEEKEKEEKPAEKVEIVEEGAYVPKKKPKLSAELKDALRKRAEIDDARPVFRRQEYGRYKRLETGWRKPKGIHSKMRMKMRYRRPMVSVGYRGPRAARGLHPSGFEEIRVCNLKDLLKVEDAERQAVRIAHTVGQKKRTQIIEKADELGIRVLNRGV